MAPTKRSRAAATKKRIVSATDQERPSQRRRPVPPPFIPPRTFVSPEAEALFDKWNISGKGAKVLIPEINFSPGDYDGSLANVIAEREWAPLCHPEFGANVSLVREFYANAHHCKGSDTVRVRGVDIDFSVESIRSAYCLPTIDVDEYQAFITDPIDYESLLETIAAPGAQWTFSRSKPTIPTLLGENAVNRYFKAINRFVCCNILPSTQTTDMTLDRILLVFCILKLMAIDVAVLIHRSIHRIASQTHTSALGFPCLITKLCVTAGVLMDSTELAISSDTITENTIKKFQDWHPDFRHNGFGFDIHRGHPDCPPPPLPKPARSHKKGSAVDYATAQISARQSAQQRLRDNTHAAAYSSRGEGASASRSFTNDQLGALFSGFRSDQQRILHRIEDVQKRQLAMAHYMADKAAFERIHGHSTATQNPLHPTFPAHLLVPYHSPEPANTDDGEGDDAETKDSSSDEF